MRTYIAAFGLLSVSLALGQSYIGRVDTIGSTTYDWQSGWSAVKCLVNAPDHGLHAVWVWSQEASGTVFPDRNMGYNYYDFQARRWGWSDSNPMHGGLSVFTGRAGYGSVDYDPATGVAIIGSHGVGTGGVRVLLARDAEPGAGIFDYADGEGVLGYTQWPRIATGQNGTIHILAMTTGYVMGYSRILPGNWPLFEEPIPVGPSPGFPCFNIAASKVSGKVALIWSNSAATPSEGYLQTSTDNGATWTGPESFPPPPAFGGDTVTSYHITSLYPGYDWDDRLHVVANVIPVVHDTAYTVPSQIWHWCAENAPRWSRIHVAPCDPAHLQGAIGYNATYADRPSIGAGSDGRLYVAWEQFDSSNVEPLTNRLRAGIWLSGSPDNGATWTPGVMITERNTYSHRFPSIIDRMVPGGASGDTVCVLYMIDSVAGFYVQGEDPASLNPIVGQFVAAPEVGVEESRPLTAYSSQPTATVLTASGFRRLARSVIFDATGRRVLDPKPGVYFIGEGLGARDQGLGRMRKVLITR